MAFKQALSQFFGNKIFFLLKKKEMLKTAVYKVFMTKAEKAHLL